MRFVCLPLSAMLLAVSFSRVQADESEFPPEQIEFFEKQIRPILVEHCQECHGPETQEAGLRLDSRAAILKGGETGPAIVPRQPQSSELILAISYDPDGYQMPPDGKLPPQKIATLEKWIEMGAPWPAEVPAETRASVDAVDLAERARHWSFLPLQQVRLPEVVAPEWCQTSVDRFILAKLEQSELPPAPEVDRRTWIRRAYLDVIGLPPTPEEVSQFLNDDLPGAESRAVDRLLASPHYGERWGRHWLDLVRYAESRGHEFDFDVANAWQYRDYVIRALNDDVPYDQFVVEHVAGDLLSAESVDADRATRFPLRLHPLTGANESILGTGFWFLGEWVHSPVDIRQEEADRFDNMIDVYSKAFLGLTVACARCHDHKFDPITQTDYYALQGYLQSSSYRQARFETMESNRRIVEQLEELNQEAAPVVMETLDQIIEPVVKRLDVYLSVAKDLIRNDVRVGTDSDSGHAQTNHLEAIADAARQRELDEIILANWIRHLSRVADDESDPFHLWGAYSVGTIENTEALQDEISRRVHAFRSALRNTDETIEAPSFLESLLATSDGPAFRKFVRPIDLRFVLGDDARRPIDQFRHLEFAEWNPLFAKTTTSQETAGEPGAMESWPRGGRVLRTRTFEIESGKIHCLIDGQVNTYVAVDSHILIKGPLHGSLVREHPRTDGWEWITLDVSAYQGHRAHIEFIPVGDRFRIRGCWQTDDVERLKSLRDHGTFQSVLYTWADRLGFDVAKSLFEDLQRSPVRSLMRSRLEDIREEQKRDALLEYAVRHPDLFGSDSPGSQARFAQISGEFIERRQNLVEQIKLVSATAPCMLDGSGEDEYVFIRGSWKKPGETVPRRFLEVFGGGQFESGVGSSGASGRLELALQMVDPDQTPILPRAIVNRIWQHYFGRGIAPTPNDLGHLGQPASHPELLDWLANLLIEREWSLKQVHREILLSATYRMSSAETDTAIERTVTDAETGVATTQQTRVTTLDPDNVLLHRMNVKRLEGEIIRDAILSVSGRLDRTLFGPSVPVHLTSFMEGRGRPAKSGPVDGFGRRSLYIAVRRNFPDPFFQAFDFPNPHSSIGHRNVSNVPAQALALLNNPMVIEQSQRWARLSQQHARRSIAEQIRVLFEDAFSRPPTQQEVAGAEMFLRQQAEEIGCEPDDTRVWADYCHVLLNLKEFVFVR